MKKALVHYGVTNVIRQVKGQQLDLYINIGIISAIRDGQEGCSSSTAAAYFISTFFFFHGGMIVFLSVDVEWKRKKKGTNQMLQRFWINRSVYFCLSVYFFSSSHKSDWYIPSGSNPSVQSCSIQCTGHQDPHPFFPSTNRVCCLVGLTCLRLTFTGMIINWQFLLPLSLVPIGGILVHCWLTAGHKTKQPGLLFPLKFSFQTRIAFFDSDIFFLSIFSLFLFWCREREKKEVGSL